MNPLQTDSRISAEPDLRKPMTRRQAIHLLGGAAAFAAGCSGGYSSSSTYTGADNAGGGNSGTCTQAAQETADPFPADGRNDNGEGTTANVLDDNGVVRSDIRSDIDGTDTQGGIPLSLTMTVLNTNNACAPLQGAYVYVWHANREGHYSQYSGGMNGGDFSDNTFLRGVQITDGNGRVHFTTIFAGRYQGRATHIHFEIYSDAAYANRIATSQLAFPAAITDQAYTDPTYSASAASGTSNENDDVFSDGTDTEMLTVTGSNSGYSASITVAVAA